MCGLGRAPLFLRWHGGRSRCAGRAAVAAVSWRPHFSPGHAGAWQPARGFKGWNALERLRTCMLPAQGAGLYQVMPASYPCATRRIPQTSVGYARNGCSGFATLCSRNELTARTSDMSPGVHGRRPGHRCSQRMVARRTPSPSQRTQNSAAVAPNFFIAERARAVSLSAVQSIPLFSAKKVCFCFKRSAATHCCMRAQCCLVVTSHALCFLVP